MNTKDHVTEPTGIIKNQWKNIKGLLFDFWHKYNCNARNWPHLKTVPDTLHLESSPGLLKKAKWILNKAEILQHTDNSRSITTVSWCVFSRRRHFPLYDSEISFLHKIKEAILFMKAYSLNWLPCLKNVCSSLGLKSKRQSKFIFVKWQHYVTF